MKKTYSLLTLIFLLGILQSCSTTQRLNIEDKNDLQTVATIQNRPVTYEELIRGYTGSLNNDSVSTVKLREFLPSYIDYRLKILEGRKLGYFEDADIQNEYKTYAKEVAKKKWINNEIESQIVDTFKERSQKELLAYHILITAKDPGYTESREIKNQLEQARLGILEGVEPDSVNVEYSSMQSGNYAGGPLPWITAGRTVKNFEDVLYSLEPGEVSEPFQTQFGFHIIYLIDERPRTPERFTSHIFVSKQGESDPGQKINNALDSLRHGMDWHDAVNNYSDDKRTASRGGEIGWVGYGMQFPESFVDKVVNASTQEGFSDIIEMDYGFHIIKIDSMRNLSDQNSLERYALSELERLGRLQPGENELYERLKEFGGLRIFNEELEQAANYLLGNTEAIDEGTAIAEFKEKPVLARHFIDFYEQEIGLDSEVPISINDALEQYINRLVEANLIEFTKERFYDYRFDMEQFLNGLVVFKVNEEYLWNPDAADEQMLKDHYNMNRSKYISDKSISYSRITATSDSIISLAKKELLELKEPGKLEDNYENIIVRSGRVSNKKSDLFRTLNSLEKKEASEIENNETWHQFYYITDIEPQREKTFEEAKPEVFNDLRDRHESEYLQTLRKKYEISLYPENVQ